MFNIVILISSVILLCAVAIPAQLGIVSPLEVIFIIIFIAGLFLFYFKRRRSSLLHFSSLLDDLQEKINLLTEEMEVKKKKLKAVPFFSRKVSFLSSLSRRFIELTDLDEILDFLRDTVGDLYPQADSILIFLAQQDKLTLARSLKRREGTIREKHGDILDRWLLKNNQSLIIEDLVKDFRFDYNHIAGYKERGMLSCISSPFSLGDKVSGVLRIESANSGAFTLDDSRLLRGICDLAVVVVERASLFKKTEELAIRDSLTSLFMRDYFFNRLREEMKRSLVSGKSLGVAMIDIDDFKVINDSYGHVVGDLVLKKLSRIMVECVGNSGNMVSRFGGEEFMFLDVECTKKELIAIAEDIRTKVSQTTVHFRRKDVNFNVSIGLAMYPDNAKDIIELVDRADHNLYKAKSSGKNKVVFE